MSETKVTLSISSNDGENSSSTTIQTDSLSELHRMLSLAGVTSSTEAEPEAAVIPTVEPEAEVVEQETYKPSASNQVRNPNHKTNNPRFADNSLDEDIANPDLDLENVNPHFITDTYANYLAFTDHEEAVARTADEFGITGEAVERVIDDARRAKEQAKEFSEDFDDYNQVEPGEEAPPAPKGFKDYLSDLGSEREIKHAEKKFNVKVEWMDSNYDSQFADVVIAAGTPKEAEQAVIAQLKEKNGGSLNIIDTEVALHEGEVDEAYGYRKNKWDQQSLDRRYDHQAALLPVPGMYSVDTLGEHEYYGKDLTDGSGAYVVMKIDTGDAAKPRYTFCATAGDASDWKSGDTVLTYHDQSGKERPAVVITNFSAAEWNDPKGRMDIKNRMASGGMDPRKKYSVRTFK
ncbi:hypothetical protein D3C87_482280 [compost metagenome]